MSGKGKKEDKKDIDCSCYAKQRTQETCPPFQNVTHPLRYYEFTQEEMKALEECDRESFYLRCLPLSALFAGTTLAAVKYGHVSRHPHWGAVPKMAAAALAGHVLGRAVSIPSCARKLREDLPSASYLGQVMRKHHDDAQPEHTKPKP